MTDSLLTTDFVQVASPDIDDDAIDEVVETLRSGWVIAGPKVGAFEKLLGDRIEAPYVRCLSSCTAALFLALRLGDVGPGDEVLVPSVAFVACANVVVQLGAKPIFVDCERDTGLVDLDHAATLVGPRTSALIALHLGGRALDMEVVNDFRDRHGLLVVEDAAHAIGAAWGERPVGAHGNPTAFSFHATKNMTTIEGGALVLESEAVAERARRLAHQGISASAWQRHGSNEPAGYDVIEPGYKLGMTDVEAAIGIHQLRRLDAAIDRRERLAKAYDDALADLPVRLEPPPPPGVRHARHLYRLLVEDDAPISRDELSRQLRARGVGSSVHFKALHELTCYRRQDPRSGGLSSATDHARRTISLPLHAALTDHDQDRVIEATRSALGGS